MRGHVSSAPPPSEAPPASCWPSHHPSAMSPPAGQDDTLDITGIVEEVALGDKIHYTRHWTFALTPFIMLMSDSVIHVQCSFIKGQKLDFS